VEKAVAANKHCPNHEATSSSFHHLQLYLQLALCIVRRSHSDPNAEEGFCATFPLHASTSGERSKACSAEASQSADSRAC
jgi:hypothetical protein